MMTSSTQESATKYYNAGRGIGIWGAVVACFAVIVGVASIAAHSLALTSGLLLGTVAVWCLGYWALSKSCYYISETKAGFKDRFRTREVQFDEIQSVTRDISKYSTTLTFVCNTRKVTMPMDIFDNAWFSALKPELFRRGIPLLTTAFGIPVKGK